MADVSPQPSGDSEADDYDSDDEQDLCVRNYTVCLLEEEYECLRSMFLDTGGQYMGKRLNAWKNCCTTKDPPPWQELLSAPCSGSCDHFLVVAGVCSWLGMLKIALMQHGVPNPNRLYKKMQKFHHNYFVCHKPTFVRRSSQVQFSLAEQRGINLIFLHHKSRDIFRVSPFPPDSESQATLTTFCQMIGIEFNPSQKTHEQRRLRSAREAAVPLVQRRKDSGGYFSEVDMGMCCNGSGDTAGSDVEAVTEELDIWQGFNEELPKAVAHITQQLVEQGTFSDAYSVRILRHEKQILSTFGPSLEQYVQDMGDLLFPVAGNTSTGPNNLDEGIMKELLSNGDTAVLLEASPCCEEDDGEDLGSVDSISEESGGEESPSDSSETEEAVTVAESDALSDHMLDASADLL